MVPIDKPGPALQMFYNFIQKTGNYDTPLPQQLTRETLEPEFKVRKERHKWPDFAENTINFF
jgi:hypothetical protein